MSTAPDHALLRAEMLEPARFGSLRSVVGVPAVWAAAVIVLAALLAPLLAPYAPTELSAGPRLAGPSASHWFGTDSYGMDIFSRVLHGARKDLLLAFAAATLAVLIGVPLGALAAYSGGKIDAVAQRVTEVIQSFPLVLFAMAVLVAVGVTLPNLAAVIAVVNVPVYFRFVRSVVLPLRHAEFTEAARVTGNSTASIIVRHLLPNVWAPVVAQYSVNFAWAIQIIAGLSFLGLGVRIPEAEWGLMVQQGAEYVQTGQWWVAFFPGAAIFATVLTLNRLGSWIELRGRSR